LEVVILSDRGLPPVFSGAGNGREGSGCFPWRSAGWPDL